MAIRLVSLVRSWFFLGYFSSPRGVAMLRSVGSGFSKAMSVDGRSKLQCFSNEFRESTSINAGGAIVFFPFVG